MIVLDRPRHEKLIADIRPTGARIRLIGDGDLFRLVLPPPLLAPEYTRSWVRVAPPKA